MGVNVSLSGFQSLTQAFVKKKKKKRNDTITPVKLMQIIYNKTSFKKNPAILTSFSWRELTVNSDCDPDRTPLSPESWCD